MSSLVQETPAKVLSLLGISLVSMAFTFAITLSQASFTKVYSPLPDPVSPPNVMALLDNVSNSFSKAVYANLVAPQAPGFAMAADNLAFIGQEAGPQILSLAGLGRLNSQPAQVAQPQVAGASTQAVVSQYYPASSAEGFSINSLYALLIQ